MGSSLEFFHRKSQEYVSLQLVREGAVLLILEFIFKLVENQLPHPVKTVNETLLALRGYFEADPG